MTKARIIRICLLLAAIFAAGVVTGRLSMPKATPVLITGRGHAQTPESLANEIQRRVGLDDMQRQKVIPILDRMIRQMLPYAPLTQERLNIFLKTMEQVRQHIRPEQMKAFDRFVNEIADTVRRGGQRGASR